MPANRREPVSVPFWFQSTKSRPHGSFTPTTERSPAWRLYALGCSYNERAMPAIWPQLISATFITFPHILYRLVYDYLQDASVNYIQIFDVEAGLSRFVRTQLRHQVCVF